MITKKEAQTINKYYYVVKSILAPYRIEHCLIGGWAVKHYANPAPTVDIDFLCSAKLYDIVYDRYGFSELYTRLKMDFNLEVRITDEMSLVRQGFPLLWLQDKNIRIDLFCADTKFRQNALSSAQTVMINSIPVRVVSLLDLLVFKSFGHRDKDVKHFKQLVGAHKVTQAQLLTVYERQRCEMSERGV